jgi:hypothetical protein
MISLPETTGMCLILFFLKRISAVSRVSVLFKVMTSLLIMAETGVLFFMFYGFKSVLKVLDKTIEKHDKNQVLKTIGDKKNGQEVARLQS